MKGFKTAETDALQMTGGNNPRSIDIGGQSLKVKQGRGLMIEDKDWKLIKTNLDSSIQSRGKRPEMLWGGVGLVTGDLTQIIGLIQSKTIEVWPDIIYILLFSLGIFCILEALCSWIKNRHENASTITGFNEFIKDIEERNVLNE